jgi:hypothetical protein
MRKGLKDIWRMGEAMEGRLAKKLSGVWRTVSRPGGVDDIFRRCVQGAVKLSSGFYRLPSQYDLLVKKPWNVIIILDGCRADYFLRLRPDAARVRSMARFTHEWVWNFAHKLHPALGRPPVLWFTANVVPDSEMASYGGVEGVQSVPLWDTDWEFLGEERIASVHPARVAGAARRHVAGHGQPTYMIVHFLQPHAPYVGRIPMAFGTAGYHAQGMGKYQCQMLRPERAVQTGQVTWQEIRQAYMANLELVLPYAMELASTLKGKVIITADHAELLGERGLFGHEFHYYSRFVQIVPWLEFDNGPFKPAELAPDQNVSHDRAVMRDRLEALGYM